MAQESGRRAGLVSSQGPGRGSAAALCRGRGLPRQGAGSDHRLFSLNRFSSSGGSPLLRTTSRTAGIACFTATGRSITGLNFFCSINSRAPGLFFFLISLSFESISNIGTWKNVYTFSTLLLFFFLSVTSRFFICHLFPTGKKGPPLTVLADNRAWDCRLPQGTSGAQPSA